MWDTLIDYFQRYPAQEKIAKLLIHHGMRIANGRVWAGDVEVADSALARAAGVDRRIVAATIKTIEAHSELAKVFANFRPTCHLRDVAPTLHWGVMEILVENASSPGILAGVSSIIAGQGISIRQAVVDDPDFIDEPKLFVVTEGPLPANLLPEVQRVPGVRSVTIY